jgi:hypothetical protein
MLKLKAVITPQQFPFIQENLTVVNRKVVNVRGGTITFSVTPLYVIAIKKVVAMKDWTNSSKMYDISTFEIKSPIEILEL